VASRTDTVKAKAAHARVRRRVHLSRVHFQVHGNVELKRGSKPNHYVDAVDLDLLVPDFVGEQKELLALL
jgi:hypothetical protein